MQEYALLLGQRAVEFSLFSLIVVMAVSTTAAAAAGCERLGQDGFASMETGGPSSGRVCAVRFNKVGKFVGGNLWVLVRGHPSMRFAISTVGLQNELCDIYHITS